MDMNIGSGWEAGAALGGSGWSEPVRASQAGVLQACLVENYARLRQRLARRIGCAELAAECLHDAWLRLDECAPARPVGTPRAYVYRIAYHLAVDRLRGQRAWLAEDLAALESVPDASPGPHAIAEARSELHAVARAVQGLPYRHGCVLVALRVDEMTRQEVARWFCVSVRSVDTMLRQTLAHCARPARPAVPAGARARRAPPRHASPLA